MELYLLDYGAGNVTSLANSLKKLGYTFRWIESAEDFDKANVSRAIFSSNYPLRRVSDIDR
jgi:imidazoleglycerol phosphate synthase glutamine amidotransferase subunit HisH